MTTLLTRVAIQKAGNISALSRILGVSRQAIQQYGDRLPKKRDAVLRTKQPKWYVHFRQPPAAPPPAAPPPAVKRRPATRKPDAQD